ncbi:hypothetical protein BpHYR1_021391 [Brachionus plicatilis]|uniref:Uncharacterized protein n=1 Tax=Brachionus plicatilis TaxID=10195 RepID=A0A3M7QCI7_BRAPC|nr:hypothetical protein BpHYR1_021391 [Brachionus plicatilis]
MSSYQAEEKNQRQLLEILIDSQYDLIQEQLNVLKNRMNASVKMSNRSAKILSTAEDEYGKQISFIRTNLFDQPKDFDILTKEHQEFLNAHDINEDYLKKFLRDIKNRLILKDKEIAKENEKMMENRQFMFYNSESRAKRFSRSSRSSFAFGSSFSNGINSQKEKKDLIDIALEFFSTNYGN